MSTLCHIICNLSLQFYSSATQDDTNGIVNCRLNILYSLHIFFVAMEVVIFVIMLCNCVDNILRPQLFSLDLRTGKGEVPGIWARIIFV